MKKAFLWISSALYIIGCQTGTPPVHDQLKQFLGDKICMCFTEQTKQGQANRETYDACFGSVFAENEVEAIRLAGIPEAKMADGTFWRKAGREVGFT